MVQLCESQFGNQDDARDGEWFDGFDLVDVGFDLMEALKAIGELLLAVVLIYGMIVPDPIGTGIKLWRRVREFYRTPN